MMNPMDMAQEIIRLSALCESKDAELAQQKERNAMMKSNMQIREDELQKQLSEAQTQTAMQSELNKNLLEHDIFRGDEMRMYEKQLSEAKAQMAMLRELLCVLRAWSYTAGDVEDEFRSHKLFPTNYRPSTQNPLWSTIINAISDTQATAFAYEREVKAKAAETAIHEYLIDQMNRDYSSWHNQEFAKLMPEFFHRLHAEFWDSIRATNKREVK